MSKLLDKLKEAYTVGIVNYKGGSPERAASPKERIAEIKRHYGLVPLEHESYPDFLARVQRTVDRKRDPTLNHPYFKSKKGNIQGETTQKIQAATKKYLGIDEEPIDGFKMRKSFSTILYGGYTIADNDGSSIVCVSSGQDNRFILMGDLTEGLESIILNGETSRKEREKLSKKVHKKLIINLTRNEEHICLHEGIHANDFNNKPEVAKLFYNKLSKEGTRKKIMLLGMLTPVVRLFYKLNLMSPLVETETLAYKTAFDELTTEAFKDAEKNLKEMEVDTSSLENILEDFKTKNSDFAEKIIKRAYLSKQGYKGVIGAAASMAISLLIANYCLGDDKPFWNYFNGSEHYIWNAIGTYMYIKMADTLTGFLIGIPLRYKARKCRKTYDKIIEKFGSAREAFYETLGMSFKDMGKLIRDEKSTKKV